MILYTCLQQETRQSTVTTFPMYVFAVLFSVKIFMIFFSFFPIPVIIICKGYIAQQMESLYTFTVFFAADKLPNAHIFFSILVPLILLNFFETGCLILLMLDLLLASISTGDKL